MSISIFTITHVPFTPPAGSIYIPLQVGRALHPDYGYLGDHTGDNISTKNPLYSELTGLYWIWKNYLDAEYLGICHYRRHFLTEDGNLMCEADYMDILSKYNVIIAEPRLGQYSYQTIYEHSHDAYNLEQTGIVIREIFPDYFDDFQKVIKDNLCYIGNLFVAPRTLFCSYCEWLFKIFNVLEPRINTEAYDDYHKRVFGFLSEQLLFVWIRHNHLSYYKAKFGLNQEKAETIQLKKKLQNYIQNKNISGAYQYLTMTLDKRPDLSLEMSDFNQDLNMIEHIINICRIEQDAFLPTLLNFSNDLTILIKHFRLLINILLHLYNNTESEEETNYLVDCKVSQKAILYILQNFAPFSADPVGILNRLALLYEDHKEYLTALSFLEEALNLQETNKKTLLNIITVLQNMGQHAMASEYQQFLNMIDVSKKFAVFTGSGIPILDYIAKQYRLALLSLGHEVFTFDKQHFEDSMQSLLSYQKQGLDAAIVFNNSCFQMRLQSGTSIWDLWQIPCYNILVDHPMYYFDTLDNAPDNGIVVCADKYHVDYINRFYPSVRHSLFLPTAGVYMKSFETLKPFSSRSIDILFIGSYKYHADVIYDTFAQQLENELLSRPNQTFENAVITCLKELGQTMTEEKLKLWIQKYRFIDVNTTAVFRLKIMQTLIDAGFTVTVYGNGWESLDVVHHPNFIHRGLITPEQGIQLMEESKIVLNHMAWFKYGASERIFEAMLAGAISLTDESEYLKEHFKNRESIMFFSLRHLDELPNIVHTLLSEPLLCESIRRNAYAKATQNHTWINRVQELLDKAK